MAFIEASKTGSGGSGDGVPVGALMTFSGEELPEGYEPAETEEQISIQQLNDNLAQTPITVGGITMSTIDEKLNFLCNGGGNDKITVCSYYNGNLYAIVLENNQLPFTDIYMYINQSSGQTGTSQGTYIYATYTGQNGWAKIDIHAKLAGKYAIKGFSTNEDRIVTVNANDIIINASTATGHNLPALTNNSIVATIQYLGNN